MRRPTTKRIMGGRIVDARSIERGDGEEVRELLAPDQHASHLGDIRPGRHGGVEVAVRGLEASDLDRAVDVAVGAGREVYVEIGAVADREALEPNDVRAGRDLQQASGPAPEMQLVGPMEGAAPFLPDPGCRRWRNGTRRLGDRA